MKNQMTVIRDKNLNKVEFFLNGSKVYPSSTSGNIFMFDNGQTILL